MFDLAAVNLTGQRTASYAEVLTGQVDEASFYRGRPGNHCIGGHLLALHAKQSGPMLGKGSGFLEAARVGQASHPFAGRQLALSALLVEAVCASSQFNLLAFCGVRPPVAACFMLKLSSQGCHRYVVGLAGIGDGVFYRASQWSGLSRLVLGGVTANILGALLTM